jgi:hypothetical protein
MPALRLTPRLAHLLAITLPPPPPPHPLSPQKAISAFIDWLCNQLRRPTNPTKSVPCAAAALATLLREKHARALFTRGGGVQLLSPLLRSCNSPTNSQLLYEICLCLWQLSYYKPAAEAMAGSGASCGTLGYGSVLRAAAGWRSRAGGRARAAGA